MSDSASKYFDDLEDKAYWAAKELEEQNKSRYNRVRAFISKIMNIKNQDNMLDLAIQITSEAHLGQFDKQGKPYILHPLWVMNKVRHLGEECMTVAVLHDLVEDTDWTIEKLREIKFNENILYSLELLDMRVGDYMRNIEMLSENEYATQVKLRDLEHNSKITRLKSLRPKDLTRIQKYHEAYTFLKPFRK